MLYDNFAMLTKRELLIRIVKLLKKRRTDHRSEISPCRNASTQQATGEVLHPQRPLHPQTQDYLDSGL